MFIRKYWLPLSVFIVAIAGVGLYLLATQPPKEPIVIYKPVEPIEKPTEQPKETEVAEGDTSQDGHFHADGTWHDEPHSDEPHSDEVHPAMAALDARYKAQGEQIKANEAYIKQLKAANKELDRSNKELDEMNAWLSENEVNWLEAASDLAPFMSLSVEEFHQRYPNLEENLYFVNRLLDLNDFRKAYVERTEGASELTRQRIYGEMERQGVLDLYRRTFLKEPEYIPFLQDFIVKYAPIDGGKE